MVKRIRAEYPAAWKETVANVRLRSGNRCECTGECGLHSTHPGKRRCVERNAEPAEFARGKVVLTTAHLCDCDPLCSNLEHLKHMCNRCHLRVDVKLHQRHRARNRRLRAEEAGQNVLEMKR